MKHNLSRRRFLQTASAGAFAFNFFPSRVFGANNRVQVAGIGVGGKGASDVSGAAGAGCDVIALCDVDEQRASSTFNKYPQANRYQDFRVMLEKEKGIDAVTVSTPDHTHAPAAILAMRLGKHVYCQKPLTHSIWEARMMAQEAEKRNVVTQMGNQAHAGEPIRRAVELVRAGIIGKVREVHVWTNRPIWPQGLKRPEESQPVPDTLNWDLFLGPAPYRPYHSAYAPFKWRGWWDFGTGALGDMACHIMDMPYWALDLGAPDTVDAEHEGATQESPPLWSTIAYQFPARGDQPPVRLTWYDGKKGDTPNVPPENVLEGQDPNRFGSILIGDKGKLFFNRGRQEWLVKHTGADPGFVMPPKSIPRTRNEDHEWVQGIRGGALPLSNFARSGPFTEVVLLGNLAIRANKKLEWDSKNLKAKNAPEADPFIKREYREGWEI